MAFRNVFRNRRRSIITIAAIAGGIFTLVLFKGMLDGIGRQSEISLIDMQFGHFQVANAGYFDDRTAGIAESIDNPGEVLEALLKIEHVEAETQRLVVPALVNFEGADAPCLAIGIDIENDESVFKLKSAVVEGKGGYLTPGPHAMIGERMANTLAIEKGDRIVWKARALGKEGAGSIQAVYLEVEGILSTGNPAIDGAAIFVPIEFMRESLMAEGRASNIVVRMDNPRHLDKVALLAKSVLEPLGYEINTWEDLGEAFIQLHRMKTTGSMIMINVFLLIVAVGIINTMLMATYERMREIGMLMALGMKGREIRRMFLMEGATLGLIGSVIGVILGSPLMWLGEVYGIPIDWFTGGKDVDMGYPIRGVMYCDLSPNLIITALLFGVGMSMLATILPAIRAGRLEPTEALRHV
jgi:putative ABC transport system permease protein